VESLTWRITPKGDWQAIGLDRTYLISYEGKTNDVEVHRVRADGYPIGTATTTRLAKKVAQRHNDR
jgi:hypothetical protein